MQHSLLVRILTAGAWLLAWAGAAHAEPWMILGARYQGMGGAGVAVVDDDKAAYWNPGSLGFDYDWEVGLTAAAQAAAEGDILRDVDQVFEFVEDFDIDDVLADMAAGDPLSDTDLQDALTLATELLPNLGRDGQGVVGSVGAGLTVRYRRFSLSGIGLSNFAADPVLDLDNLSFNTSATAADQITNAFGILPPAGAVSNQALADDIAAVFQAAGLAAGDAQNAAENLIFQAEAAGIDTSNSQIADTIGTIADATALVGSGDLSENASGAFVRGAATVESGIGIGYTLPIPLPGVEDRIAIGSNLKYIYGTTFSKFIRYNEVDDVGDVLDELTDARNRKTSHTWGVDLGMVYRPFEFVRVGVTARNVNSPKLDTADGGDYVIEPQVRGGVAVNISPNWLVAADIDLTKNETDSLQGFESRIFSAGTELGIPLGDKARIALRAGLYTNLASDAANALALTGGLGLRIANFHLDIAGGASPDTTRIQFDKSKKVPTRANLAVSLKWAGRF
jgi:hypothetical protein